VDNAITGDEMQRKASGQNSAVPHSRYRLRKWFVAICLLLLLLLFVITFMKGIPRYIPDTNLVLGAYNVAAVLLRGIAHVNLLPC
jgi:hypothetical protein